MAEVISDEFHLLQMMSRFGIAMGFGEKTVKEVCEAADVDTATFLAVANFLKSGEKPDFDEAETDGMKVKALMDYLARSHAYFLNFQLPSIRRKLLEALDCSVQADVAFLILKFFDEFMGEVRRHLQFEDKKVFAYVNRLIDGTLPKDFDISQFARSHEGMDAKLQELKKLIIKYYNAGERTEQLNQVLFDIFVCEADLRAHCQVESELFVPAVGCLETEVKRQIEAAPQAETESEELLSEREKEVVKHVVRGLTNKEIAAELFISLNTVLTHRKNISRKLNIHSSAGLTIYAIASGIVALEEVKL